MVVKKPATPGYEHLPALLLQAHVDMVNEKNSNSDHDFTKDGLKLILEGNILRATAPPWAQMTARALLTCWL